MAETTQTEPATTRYDEQWDAQLEALKQYINENEGKVPYPRPGQDAAVERIGQWVSKQRKAWRKGNLREDRRSRLLELDGVLVARRFSEIAGVDIGNIRDLIAEQINEHPKETLSKTEALASVDTALNIHAENQAASEA